MPPTTSIQQPLVLPLESTACLAQGRVRIVLCGAIGKYTLRNAAAHQDPSHQRASVAYKYTGNHSLNGTTYLTAERSEPCHAACSNSALAHVTLRVHAPQSQDCVHGFANETPHIAIFLALIAQFTPQETPATYPTNLGAI